MKKFRINYTAVFNNEVHIEAETIEEAKWMAKTLLEEGELDNGLEPCGCKYEVEVIS